MSRHNPPARGVIEGAHGDEPLIRLAVAAHVKMGTYEKHGTHEVVVEFKPSEGCTRVYRLLKEVGRASRGCQARPHRNRILIGVDADTDEEVCLNPQPAHDAPNPHMAILGESGFDKIKAICRILTGLERQKISSIVFDGEQRFVIGSSVSVGRGLRDLGALEAAVAQLRITFGKNYTPRLSGRRRLLASR